MTSKERVVATIARKKADKVPLGFYTVDHDTIEKVIGRPTYVRNKIAQEIALWEGRRQEVAESLKKDTVEFYRKIDCADIILPKEARLLPPRDYEPLRPRQIEENKWEDKFGRIWQAVPECNEVQCIHDPRPPRTDYKVEDFAKPLNATPPDPSIFEAIDYVLEHLGNDRYVCSITPIVAMTQLGGHEHGMMLYALDPDVIHACNRQRTDRQNALDRYYIRKGCAGVFVEQDMAGTNGPLISPAMFRDICMPYLKERIASIKRYVSQVGLHNCGNNIPLMEMFIECGIDYYQSLQTTAGMEIGVLKEMFGDRMTFWGGIAVEKLILGSPDDVRKEVRVALERGAPGGGFILGPSHSIAKNTKYENFMALLDEFVKLRDKF
jgi:uroporphyrinogen-III decarboxylase